MEKIKRLIAEGASLSMAVRIALGDRSLSQVALERGVNRSNLASVLGGNRTPTDRDIAVLIAELEGTPDDWRLLIAEQQQRRTLAVG